MMSFFCTRSVGAFLTETAHLLPERAAREQLLAHILGRDLSWVIAHAEAPLSPMTQTRTQHLYKKRARGVPLAYLTGTREFYGRSFAVTPATLIPRPESEGMIPLVADTLQNTPSSTAIYDIGTGSGALGITLAAEYPETPVYATDISRRALRIAQKNNHSHRTHVHFYRANLLDSASLQKTFALHDHAIIVANLPYVDHAHKERLLATPYAHELRYEPGTALWAHDGGLALYKTLVEQTLASTQIAKHSTHIYEIDPAQKDSLHSVITKYIPQAQISFINDLAGRTRFCTWSQL